MKRFWPFSFYFLYYAAFASMLPFFVLYYQHLGFSGAQIGLLTGIPPLITMVCAPLGTNLADSTYRHKLVLGLSVFLAVCVILLMPSFKSFAVVFLLIALFNIFISPAGSLSDSGTMSMLGDDKAMYGRIRLGGTLGWGIFAPIAGRLVQQNGLNMSFWLFAGIMGLGLISISRFEYGGHHDVHPAEKTDIKLIWANKPLVFFLALSFLAGVGAFSSAAYLYPYMAGLGATETQMGIASTMATLTELPIFFFGNVLVKRFTSYRLFVIVLILLGVRSLLYFAVDTPFQIYLVQIFGGTLFPAMWLAAVSYVDEKAPQGLKSTAQGLLGAMTFGFGSAVSGFVGGPLLESVGGQKMFLVLGIVIFVGVILMEGGKQIANQITHQEQ